ncbi:hypothetical protein GCM10009809_12110 [Isoptericola hypogeus]|uniref:Fibronectin type-III domain-containing protein n=1 Tax=Isoptericola hypogeus TaxID=300179 RepID=A0ABN2J4E1_9MICO
MGLAARAAASALAVAVALFALAPAASAADTQPPTAPSNVRVLAVTPTVVSVAFTGSTDDVGLKWYTVHVGGRSQATTSPSRTDVGGLRSETTYSLTVRAVDRAGNVSADSTPVTFTTGAWPAVTGLRATAASGGTVSLAWDRVTGWDPYRFLVFDNGRAEAVAKGEQATMRGLAGGSHSFTVRALHVTDSLSLTGSAVTVQVAPRGSDTTAPSSPGSPRVVEDQDTGDFLTTWQASTDPFDAPSSLRYDLLQTWRGELFTAGYGVQGTSFGGSFFSAVRAVDPAGNRSAPALTALVW